MEKGSTLVDIRSNLLERRLGRFDSFRCQMLKGGASLRKCIVFDNQELLPKQWHFMLGQPVWAFNPGILKVDGGWIMAYRIVGYDRLRRIAMCKLNHDFEIVSGSQVPYSDYIELPKNAEGSSCRRWFADPRLYRFGCRTFVYWNSGWEEPKNSQFLQEFEVESLLPIGNPKEFVIEGPRQPLEKNWALFGEEQYYAVYSVTPHRILEFTLDNENYIQFKDSVSTDWSTAKYSAEHGKLRGGAPPVKLHGAYYSFCHSLFSAEDGLRYMPTVYCFDAKYPFTPLNAPADVLKLGNPFGSGVSEERLNSVVAQVLYPCGAHFQDGYFIVSYGINDENCALSIFPAQDVAGILE